MKLVRVFFCYLFLLSLLVSYLPSYADCGDASSNDLDKECNTTQCAGTDEDVKGCYLPPEPGKVCPATYPKKADICCCK